MHYAVNYADQKILARKNPSPRRRANPRTVSFRNSLRWPIDIINPADKTKLSCDTPHRRSTIVSLKTNPLYPDDIYGYRLK